MATMAAGWIAPAATVHADRDQLEQLLINLVKNAVEAKGRDAEITVSSHHFVNIDGKAYTVVGVTAEKVFFWQESDTWNAHEWLNRLIVVPITSYMKRHQESGAERIDELNLRLRSPEVHKESREALEQLFTRRSDCAQADVGYRECGKLIVAVEEDEIGELTHIRYEFTDGTGSVVVATTRPETMLGDCAVAVNPEDPRYKHLIGEFVALPLTGRRIPIIADDYVDPETITERLELALRKETYAEWLEIKAAAEAHAKKKIPARISAAFDGGSIRAIRRNRVLFPAPETPVTAMKAQRRNRPSAEA